MARSKPWDNETEGAELVAAIVGGIVAPRDIAGAPSGTHDFDIELPDGSKIALEVTQEVHGGILAQRAVEERLDWRFPELSYVWVVDVYEPCDLKALHKQVPKVLQSIEKAQIDKWHRATGGLDSAAEELLGRLGVALVYRLSPATPGEVIVGSAPTVGSTSSQAVLDVVEDHAHRADNVRKLEKADAAERHLLIWVHADCHPVVATMHDDPPNRVPELPKAIDAAWVITAYETPTVWRVNRDGWTDLTLRYERGPSAQPPATP